MALTDEQEKEAKDTMEKLRAKIATLEKGEAPKKGGRISALEAKLAALEAKLAAPPAKKDWFKFED